MNRGKGEEMDGVFPDENQCRVSEAGLRKGQEEGWHGWSVIDKLVLVGWEPAM